MFKHITIHLRGPICLCREQKMVWRIFVRGRRLNLELTCRTCGKKHVVPDEELKAVVQFDAPHSDTPTQTGGNVVPFRRTRKK